MSENTPTEATPPATPTNQIEPEQQSWWHKYFIKYLNDLITGHVSEKLKESLPSQLRLPVESIAKTTLKEFGPDALGAVGTGASNASNWTGRQLVSVAGGVQEVAEDVGGSVGKFLGILPREKTQVIQEKNEPETKPPTYS